MESIILEPVNGGNIGLCRDLCNELMAFQKAQATFAPECFDMMSFDTRMKKSFESAQRSHVLIAKDNCVPAGYVFSTIDNVTESDRAAYPDWAPKVENGVGFYPDWLKLPQKIGCLSNLYLREKYRSTGLGAKLFDAAMLWLESFEDVDLSFVFISNGNKNALDFYLKHGFTHSHEVFGGFITAAYRVKKQNA